MSWCQAVENLKKARETLGEKAKLLAGIMPVVSQRNAIFMENEINGIHVEQAIIDRFAGLDRKNWKCAVMGVVPPYLLFGWWIFLIERRSMIKDRETLIM